jgi:hypothetical protein
MSGITERVALGAAFLDEHDEPWWRDDVDRAIDLDDLDLKRTDLCVLGQRCPLETLAAAVNADPDELCGLDFGEAFYVNASRLAQLLPPLDPFGDRATLTEWAIPYGFVAAHPAEYPDLTAEWARVIRERRAA